MAARRRMPPTPGWPGPGCWIVASHHAGRPVRAVPRAVVAPDCRQCVARRTSGGERP